MFLSLLIDSPDNWRTYVSVHAYAPKSIKTALKGGIKVIGHRQLLDEDIAKLMAKNSA